ncbi:MAG: glucose-1-phosphate adenylyltransferase subunit GlgD [Clostridiales bacterium]|nr:glucose-1-phosphate adenylyltransferase subunit GlgD [Clostridiales bacterium]
MKDMMSVLFASDKENKLNELTLHRTTASLPFGGRYRLIDFTLSNLVNSGITQIGIVARSNYQSLMDHIRQGRDWDLNRKNGGISVFPPFVYNSAREIYKGKIEALYSIMDFLTKSREEYVLISNCNVAANINFEKMLDKHIESGATLSMLYHKAFTTTSRRIVINIDDNKTVTDIYETEYAGKEESLISLNIYIIKKDVLIELVQKAYARGFVNFEKDILFKLVSEGKVSAFEVGCYAPIIDDIKSYYAESMNLLKAQFRNELFENVSKIYTKVKDSVPTVYKEKAKVTNSLLADGCEINGLVENSILFRNVKIEEGAVVKNSIVMENGIVGKNSSLKYAITDKDVTITADRDISGFITYPIVIVKGKTV